jgi:hypothetical protein
MRFWWTEACSPAGRLHPIRASTNVRGSNPPSTMASTQSATPAAPRGTVALLYGLAVRRLATGDPTATGTAEALRLLLRAATTED